MENEKVKYLIDMIYDMDIKNKLRLNSYNNYIFILERQIYYL